MRLKKCCTGLTLADKKHSFLTALKEGFTELSIWEDIHDLPLEGKYTSSLLILLYNEERGAWRHVAGYFMNDKIRKYVEHAIDKKRKEVQRWLKDAGYELVKDENRELINAKDMKCWAWFYIKRSPSCPF